MEKHKTLRYEQKNPCGECGECVGRVRCEPARHHLRPYRGIRPTSDGFDCALPISIDSHSICAYACRYCFADNLVQHRAGRALSLGQTSLKSVENFFSGKPSSKVEIWRRALKYDKRNKYGFPCPIQLGALCEPGDHIERQQGWLLEFMKIAIKYKQPIRMSTKGTVFLLKDYLDVISQAPHLFWVAFSIISPDDELLEKIDIRAPNATQRLKAMKALSDVGVKTSLRFRPLFPGVSDSTKNYPKAYQTLIEKAAEAGAIAVSTEVGFVPGGMDTNLKARWLEFSRIIGVPLVNLYNSFGSRQSCIRPPYTWTENIMHAIYEVAHKHKMVMGVSDPVWKQLSDSGCCCGILPDDPVFGNWQTESATNQLLIARDTGRKIFPEDIVPEWAYDCELHDIVNVGVVPPAAYKHRNLFWSHFLFDVWNKVGRERSPLNYFQGALMPVEQRADGGVVYEYRGLQRSFPERVPYWKVEPGLGTDLTPVLEYPRKFPDPP